MTSYQSRDAQEVSGYEALLGVMRVWHPKVHKMTGSTGTYCAFNQWDKQADITWMSLVVSLVPQYNGDACSCGL